MGPVGPVIPRFKPKHVRAGLAVELRDEHQHSGVEFLGRRGFVATGLDRHFIDFGKQLSCQGRQVFRLPKRAGAANGDDLGPERSMHVGDLARYELQEEHIGMVLRSIIDLKDLLSTRVCPP